jgi:hypothetical protein
MTAYRVCLLKSRQSAPPNISVTSLRYPAKPQPQNSPQNWISFVAKLGWLPTPVRRAGGDFLSPCFHQSEAFPTEAYSWYVLIMVDAFAPLCHSRCAAITVALRHIFHMPRGLRIYGFSVNFVSFPGFFESGARLKNKRFSDQGYAPPPIARERF